MKKLFVFLPILIAAFILNCGGGSSSDDYTCSAEKPSGSCPSGKICNGGVCVSESERCSTEFPLGYCESGFHCESGSCIEDPHACDSQHPTGFCADGLVCKEGDCVERTADITEYKMGIIGQKIDTNARPNVLLDEYHYYIYDSNGRNQKKLTTETNRCLNEYSCFVSTNIKYFLYFMLNADNTITLKKADIGADYVVNFAAADIVTTKIKGNPVFLSDGKNVIYIDASGQFPWVVKYNMETKAKEQIIKFSTIVKDQDGNDVEVPIEGDFIVSHDGSKLVYSIDKGYQSGPGLPIEIHLMDLTTKTTNKIYEYARVNLSGIGVKFAAINYSLTKVAFISTSDNQHRVHIVSLDGSDFIAAADQVSTNEETGVTTIIVELGKYIGPDYNACDSITGVQVCDIMSKLYFSLDDKTLYFAGKTGKWTEISPKVNLYKYVIASKELIKLTDKTKFEGETYKYEDYTFLSVVFNPETGHTAYMAAVQGNIKNNESYYLDFNSTESTMGEKQLTNTSDIKELTLQFLKP